MSKNWNTFFNILQKEERVIIGLMSGTSLDGLDVALCRIKGHGLNTELKLLKFHTVPYEDELRTEIQAIFSK
ncbi:MAG: anhydro-N-acetylmuramic acid kinase, partial [Pedobacter sp.]|nr:anhydro-N-acetylmuramic acid kinase [Pedobacter sp.]